MSDSLSIIIKTILSDDVKDIENQIQQLSSKIKERLKLKLKIDTNDFEVISRKTEEIQNKFNQQLISPKNKLDVNTSNLDKYSEKVIDAENSLSGIVQKTKEWSNNIGLTIKQTELLDVETGDINKRITDTTINYKKQREELEKINTEQSKYWSNRVKETMSDMTKKPDELVKMADYYKQLSVESNKLAQINKKKEQSELEYWGKRRKEAVEAITQNNTVLQQMKQYYTQLEKISQRDFNYGSLIPGVNASTFTSDSFSSYIKQQYGDTAEIVGRFNDKQLKTGEIITQTGFRVRETDDKWRVYQATLNKTTGEMRVLDNGLRDVTNKQMSFNEALKIAIVRITQWGIATSLIYGSFHQLKDGLATLKEIDTELINIAKVTEYTAQEMRELTRTAIEAGQAFGRTPVEYLQSVTEFARAGFGKQAEEYAKLSLLLQNVGDVTAEVANETLIATNAGFQLGGSYESLMQVIDKFNNISNKNATTVNKMSEAMKVGASVFHAAGMSMDETIAIIGTATASTQRAGSEISRAWRTILMNIRQVKDEEAEVTEESMAKAEKALNSVGIVVRDTPETFRPMFEIIRDLGNAWENLTQVEQAYVAEALAGKRQANVLISTLQNWDMAEKQLVESINAAGSALEENEIYMQSWEARAKQFTASLTSLWSNIINTDSVKTTVTLGISLINILDKIISTFGFLTPAIFTASTIMLVLGKGTIPILSSSFAALRTQVSLLPTALGVLNLTLRQTNGLAIITTGAFNALKGAMSTFLPVLVLTGITVVIQQVTKAIMDQKKEAKELEEQNKRLVEVFSEQKSNIDSLVNEYNNLSQIESRTTEEQERYLDVQNQLSELLPNLTDKIDAKGQAHLKSAEAIKEEIDRTQELVDKQRELESERARKTSKDRLKDIADYEKKIEEIQKQINMGGEWFHDGMLATFIEYDREAVLKLEIEILNLQQKIADLNSENDDSFSNFVKSTLTAKSSIKLTEEAVVDLIERLKNLGFNILSENLEESILDFAKKIYDEDLNNFNNSAELKRKINNLVVQEIGEDWADYYDTQEDALKNIANWGLAGKSSASSQAKTLLDDLKKKVIDVNKEVSNLKSGFGDITDEIKFLNNVIKEIQENTFSANSKQKILEQYPQLLAYMNDEIELQKQLQKMVEIYKEKQIKAFLDVQDGNNVTRRQMLETDEAYFNNVIKSNAEFLKIIKDAGIDSIEDFKTISEAKEAIETATIGRLSRLWKKYYGAADPTQDAELFKRISAMAMFGSSDDPRTQLAKDTLAGISNRNKALKALEELVNEDIGKQLSGINLGKSTSSSSSKYTTDQYAMALSELDKQLKTLEYTKSKLSQTSEEYRNITQQEIDVIKQKQQLAHEEANRLRELIKTVKQGTKEYDEYTKTINDLGKTWVDLQSNIDVKTLEIVNSKTDDLNNVATNTKDILSRIKTELQYLIPGTSEYTNKLQEQVNITKEHINALQDLQNHYEITLASESLSIAQKDQYITKLKEVKQALFNMQMELKSQLASQADEVISIYKSMYEQQRQIALNSIDDQISAEEKRHKAVIDNLDSEISKYEELIRAKLKALEKDADQESYAKRLAKAQKEAQEIQNKIDILSLDDSYEARAKREDLNKQLADKIEEIEEMQNKRSLDMRKDNLNDLLDNHKKQVDNKKKTEDKIYNMEKDRLEKIKKETERYWNEQINNERKWMQVKQDIMNGNLNAVKDSFASFTNILNGNLQFLGNSVVNNLIDKMQQAKIAIDSINSQMRSLPSSDTYDIGSSPNMGSGSNQKGLVKTGMLFTDAAAIAGVNVVYDQATNTIKIGNLDTKFSPTGIGGTYLNSQDRLVIDNVDRVKELLKFAGGDVSKFHDGGIVGGSADNLTQKVNEFFNLKPNETIVKSLLKELQIPQKNILNNFKPNMATLINSLTPQVTVASGGDGTINYNMNIRIDKVENTDKGVDSFFKRINDGMNKLGK